MNKKSGISMIALAITIVVMLILLSGVVITYSNIHEDTIKMEFAKEIYSVQKLVEQYHFKNNEYPVKNKITISMQTLGESSKTQFKEEEGFDSGTVELYEIDLAKADVTSVKRGTESKAKDKYLVSNKTGKVYYYLGEDLGGTIYYTLTDDLKSLIGL